MSKSIPVKIRCQWKRDVRLPAKSLGSVYYCSNCSAWTANLPLYKNQICPAKDRRNWREGIRGRRIGDQQ